MEHPTSDELLAYGTSPRLSLFIQKQIREHLVGCQPCRDLQVQLSSEFDAFVNTSGSPSDAAEAWLRAKDRILPPESKVKGSDRTPALSKSKYRRMRWPVAAAIALAALTAGSAWVIKAGQSKLAAVEGQLRQADLERRQLAGLRAELSRLQAPQANTPIWDVLPQGALERSANPKGVHNRFAWTSGSLATLLLHLESTAIRGPVRARLTTENGSLIANVENLQAGGDGVVYVSVWRRQWDQGLASIELYSGDQTVGRYRLLR
jgi:hypothetical protein